MTFTASETSLRDKEYLKFVGAPTGSEMSIYVTLTSGTPIVIGSVSATVDSVYIQSGNNMIITQGRDLVGSMYCYQSTSPWAISGVVNTNPIGVYRSGNNILFNAQTFLGGALTTDTQTTGSLDVGNYSRFLMYNTILSSGATVPTDILFKVQFDAGTGIWHTYTNDFFGDLRYEDTATSGTALSECYDGKMLGHWLRLSATATGTSGTGMDGKFIVTTKFDFLP